MKATRRKREKKWTRSSVRNILAIGEFFRLIQYQIDFWTSNMVFDTLALREKFQCDVRECVKKKDWRKVLQIRQKYEFDVTSEILWTFPTEYCLNYLKAIWKSFNITNILSVGCGSGLLEFIIKESMGLSQFFLILNVQL